MPGALPGGSPSTEKVDGHASSRLLQLHPGSTPTITPTDESVYEFIDEFIDKYMDIAQNAV